MTQPTQQKKLIIAADADQKSGQMVCSCPDCMIQAGLAYDKDDNSMRRLRGLLTEGESAIFISLLILKLGITTVDCYAIMQSPTCDQFEAWGKAKGLWI